jgi:hypothetical protein
MGGVKRLGMPSLEAIPINKSAKAMGFAKSATILRAASV